jgi:predicted DNA-binding protein (MmcQ/YjbR family)
MASNKHLERAEMALRKYALAYPDTTEDFPWEHRAIKVKGKVFLFLFRDASQLSLSVKLPESNRAALALPFASPTQYGLGKSGWVTARFEGHAEPPVEMLTEWIDESFRAVAPKRILAKLDSAATTSLQERAPPPSRVNRRVKKRRTVTKQASASASRN